MNAVYEMQFGCVERMTHFNTMHDLAKYEVPGHKWCDLSKPGFGVALLSENEYGFSVFDGTMRMSLLRAPTYPDPTADRGSHAFAYAVMPHTDSWREADVVAEAFRFNIPLRLVTDARTDDGFSFASVDHPNLVLDTIKQSDDDSEAFVVRLYESQGSRGTATLQLNIPCQTAVLVNLLEVEVQSVTIIDGKILLSYLPFQIFTLKLK